MAKKEVVNIVVECPFCKKDNRIIREVKNEFEAGLVLDQGTSVCDGCGQRFNLAGDNEQ